MIHWQCSQEIKLFFYRQWWTLIYSFPVYYYRPLKVLLPKHLRLCLTRFDTSSFVFPSVSLPFDLLSWNNTPLGKTKLFLEGSEIMCVLYHYIKVSLAWESEVCWLRNKKKSSNFTKTSYTKLKSLLTWSYQSSLHNYRRIKYL